MYLITNLPVTEDRYNAIVTCIDYTKALIGKTSESVAQIMYQLLCHFGAVRIHILDQGREFVNQVRTMS